MRFLSSSLNIFTIPTLKLTIQKFKILLNLLIKKSYKFNIKTKFINKFNLKKNIKIKLLLKKKINLIIKINNKNKS